MKLFCIAAIAAIVLSACTSTTSQMRVTSVPVAIGTINNGLNSPLTCPGTLEYRPLPAFPVANYTEFKTDAQGRLSAIDSAWPDENKKVNALLPNIASAIRVDDLAVSGNVASFFRASYVRKRVTIDFMKYRSEPVRDHESNQVYLYSRIGAGLRLVLDIETTDSSLSSGDLIAIAVSAQAGLTRGHVSAEIIGMNADAITLAMPFTSDLSAGSIKTIVEALAIIKAKLHEANTVLSPQFIARIECLVEKPSA